MAGVDAQRFAIARKFVSKKRICSQFVARSMLICCQESGDRFFAKGASMPVLEYKSFLVRIWREKDEPSMRVDWLAEVENVQTGKRWKFESLDELIRFIGKQEGEITDQENEPNSRPLFGR